MIDTFLIGFHIELAGGHKLIIKKDSKVVQSKECWMYENFSVTDEVTKLISCGMYKNWQMSGVGISGQLSLKYPPANIDEVSCNMIDNNY